MATKLKFGNVVLCEHVVEGARKKHTLVNVFAGDVVIGQMPAGLALGIYMEYIPDKTAPVQLDLTLRLGGKDIVKAKVGADAPKKGEMVTFILPMFQIMIQENTVLELVAVGEGYKKTRILSKRIFKGELPA